MEDFECEKGMSRLVKDRHHPFTMVSNSLIYDKRISTKSRMLMIYMLSKPDNWKFNRAAISKELGEGLDALKSMFAELKQYGYVEVKRIRGADGRIVRWATRIFEFPKAIVEDQPVASPQDGSTRSGKDHHLNNTKTNTNTKSKNKTNNHIVELNEVFDYWKTILNHNRARLDSKRMEIITKALQHSSLEELKNAIVGCSLTPFNMGDNDRGEIYDDISHIMRDRSHVERFMRNAERPPKGKSKPTYADRMADDKKSMVETMKRYLQGAKPNARQIAGVGE